MSRAGLGLGIQRSRDAENDVIMIETIVSVLYYVLQTRWWNGASTNHENSSIICPEWVKNWHRLGIEHSYKYVDKMISNLNKYCTVLSLPQCSYFHVNSEEYNWNISFVLTVFILVPWSMSNSSSCFFLFGSKDSVAGSSIFILTHITV